MSYVSSNRAGPAFNEVAGLIRPEGIVAFGSMMILPFPSDPGAEPFRNPHLITRSPEKLLLLALAISNEATLIGPWIKIKPLVPVRIELVLNLMPRPSMIPPAPLSPGAISDVEAT